jgi:integrase
METSLWLSNPAEAHREWREGLAIADRAYAEQSQRLYLSLFGKFCVWLTGQKCNLQTITMADLGRFLDTLKGRNGKEAANRTKRTYVAEIDRVFAHLQNLEVRQDNPARSFLEILRLTTPLRPRSIKLPAVDTRARYVEGLKKLSSVEMHSEDIQCAAMNLLMLDCGLTLKELQKMSLLHVSEVSLGYVTAPGHRLLEQRRTSLTPEAQHWLKRWLDVRKTLKAMSPGQYRQLSKKALLGSDAIKGLDPVVDKLAGPGHRVFVSFTGRSHAQHALRSTGLVIDRIADSAIYLSAQQVLVDGELSKEERLTVKNKGPQALRSLCCASMVIAGQPAGEIAAFLGLRRVDQVWAMAKALKGSDDVLP